MTVNPDMLVLARESRGLTQGELAAKLNCTQGYVSKIEAGIQPVPDNLVQSLAAALEYPEDFFRQSDRVLGYGTPCLYHRKQKSIPALVLRKLQAIANVIRLQVRNLSRGVEIDPVMEIPRLDVDEYGAPERVAEIVRRHWKLPDGPVSDVVGLVEAAGGVIVRVSFGTRQLDAVSVWAPGEAPVFLLNRDSPWDRVRFTLAHELGHMIMHSTLSPDMESEADRFASEFLMPSDVIRPELQGLRFETLAILKQRWRVSMAALARKAHALGCITRDQYRRIFTRLSQLGYRLVEPNPISAEEPKLLGTIISVQLHENGLALPELAHLARSQEREFRERFLGSGLRLVV